MRIKEIGSETVEYWKGANEGVKRSNGRRSSMRIISWLGRNIRQRVVYIQTTLEPQEKTTRLQQAQKELEPKKEIAATR